MKILKESQKDSQSRFEKLEYKLEQKMETIQQESCRENKLSSSI
jgi:hypothetical protein